VVLLDRGHGQAGQARGGGLGRGHRGGGEHERRLGPVGGADPPQPAQDLRDVGAEDAAVVVALVDDDIAQRRPEAGPAAVAGKQRPVQHVGVGQEVVGVLARPVALLAAAVAVMRRRPHVQAQRLDAGELVVGERLGGGEIEHRRTPLAAGAALLEDRRERGELVAQALARRRPGGQRDVTPDPGGLGGGDLVLPGSLDPARTPGGHELRSRPGRPLRYPRGACGQHLQVAQAVLAAGNGREALDHGAAGRQGAHRGAIVIEAADMPDRDRPTRRRDGQHLGLHVGLFVHPYRRAWLH